MFSVVSVVPTYRPDADVQSLTEGLSRVSKVLVTDDGSPCTSDQRLSSIAAIPGVRMLRHHVNEGIGRGLNDGLAFAQECGTAWMLTVDQDSRLPNGYIEHLIGVADDVLSAGVRVGVMGALNIDDASGDFTYPTEPSTNGLQPYPETEELISSGSLWNVAALVSLGGFDSTLGMDAVDSAACLSLREAGYHVIALPGITFEHRIGYGERTQFLGRSVLRTGHSRQRRQRTLTNRLRLFPREWRQSPVHAIRTVRRAGIDAVLGGPTRPRD